MDDTYSRSEVKRVMASRDPGVYAISVAAEMVSMQIQNLRVYERLIARTRKIQRLRAGSPRVTCRKVS